MWYFPRCWAAWWYHVLLHLLLYFPWSLRRTLVFWFVFHKLFSFLCDSVNSWAAKPNLAVVSYSSISLKSTPGEIPLDNLPELCSCPWLPVYKPSYFLLCYYYFQGKILLHHLLFVAFIVDGWILLSPQRKKIPGLNPRGIEGQSVSTRFSWNCSFLPTV